MSTTIETYLIYGLKFGEEFTHNFWEKECYDNEQWDNKKPKDEPFFITDGMCGDYTFFGFIIELADGWSDPKEQEINISFNKAEIISKFNKFYPELNISDEDIKLFFLPHWV